MNGSPHKRKRTQSRFVLLLESLVVILAVLLTLAFLEDGPLLRDAGDARRDGAAKPQKPADPAVAAESIDLELVKSLAWQGVASENYRAALAQYNLILAVDPAYAQVWMERGIARARSGDHAGAVDDYSTAIELAVRKALAYYNRGISYDALGMTAEAISDYTRAIEQDASYVNAWNNRGYVYSNEGDWELAIADFSKAIELDPYYATAWNSRGAAHAELGYLDAAREDYERAIELDPNLANAYYNYGILLYRGGDYQASLNAFDAEVQSDAEKTPEMWNNHGSVLHMLGQYGRAIESYSEALRLDESYELARINRAFAYRDLGAYEAAVGDFSVVLDNKPGWAELYLLRGNVLERIDNGSTLAGESYLQFMTRAGTVLKGKRAIADHEYQQTLDLRGDQFQLFYVYVRDGDKLNFSVKSVGSEDVDPLIALRLNGVPVAGNDDSDQTLNAALFDVSFAASGWVEVVIGLSAGDSQQGQLLFSVQQSG